MIKGIIFDYGGTLDTHGCHWGKMLFHAYERQHIDITWAQFRDAYVVAERALSKPNAVKADFTFRDTLDKKVKLQMEHLFYSGEIATDRDTLKKQHRQVVDDLYSQLQSNMEESRNVLKRLREQCPMVLVSNFYGNINAVLREFSIDHFFDAVIESATVGIRKPDPAIFALGVDALKLQPKDVLVVGDSYYKDIEPANRLGCKTCWLKGEGWNDEQYDETLPSQVITRLADININL